MRHRQCHADPLHDIIAWIIVLALTMIRRSLSQSETDAVEQSLYAEHEGWHKSAVEPFRQVVVKPIPPGCF
jgi:hypothetical protein